MPWISIYCSFCMSTSVTFDSSSMSKTYTNMVIVAFIRAPPCLLVQADTSSLHTKAHQHVLELVVRVSDSRFQMIWGSLPLSHLFLIVTISTPGTSCGGGVSDCRVHAPFEYA